MISNMTWGWLWPSTTTRSISRTSMAASFAAATVAPETKHWLPYTLFAASSRDAKFTVSPITAMLLRTRYAEGLTAYRAECWDEARTAFNAGLAAVPDDGPSMMFVKRIDDLQKNGPPANWDGSWRLDRK